ncbi:unnamed protein product [Pylaiella littoralis]
MMGKINLVALLGITVALVGTLAPAAAQTCTGDIRGVQSTSEDICCTLECGVCGGEGCNPGNSSTLTAFDCCTAEIESTGVMCIDTQAAPCILSTPAASNDSTCENGQTGVQDPDTDVCCPLDCGDFCGGGGCGTIPGVDGSQCCASAILDSGILCGDGVQPPCAIVTLAENDTTCSNGLPGVESDNLICCVAACGTCGGQNCGDVAGFTGDDCCIENIEANNELCSDKGFAPCVVDPPEVTPSTCPNGLDGVFDGTNVCCAEACNGVCGGTGCGDIAGTAGASDCCSADILASNVTCTDAAPCVMADGTFTPAPSAAGAVTPAPSAGSRDMAFTMAPTAGSRDLDLTSVPSAAPSGMTASAAPSAGSRGLDLTRAPAMAPGSTMAPTTSGSASVSAGSVVTFAAMVGGMFAVVAAARN